MTATYTHDRYADEASTISYNGPTTTAARYVDSEGSTPGGYYEDTAFYITHTADPCPEPLFMEPEIIDIPDVPKKIYPVKTFLDKPGFFLKQPVSRAGFKRGQRN